MSPGAMSATSDAFGAEFAPLLQRAAANAATLVTIGEAKERNLLRIHAAQQEMNASLAAADAWLAAHVPPAADEPAVAAYQHGAAAIRLAMNEAQAGFLRFDFARVARATTTMRQGAADLNTALTLLDEPAKSPATPAGPPG